MKISKEKWLKLKPLKKNTFFVKKLGQAGYGHEGLKVRTLALPGKKHKDKKVATPRKIAAMTGEHYPLPNFRVTYLFFTLLFPIFNSSFTYSEVY